MEMTANTTSTMEMTRSAFWLPERSTSALASPTMPRSCSFFTTSARVVHTSR